jgi:hypothetical protein
LVEDLFVSFDASPESLLELRVGSAGFEVLGNRVSDEFGRRYAVHTSNKLHVLSLVFRLTDGCDV